MPSESKMKFEKLLSFYIKSHSVEYDLLAYLEHFGVLERSNSEIPFPLDVVIKTPFYYKVVKDFAEITPREGIELTKRLEKANVSYDYDAADISITMVYAWDYETDIESKLKILVG